MHDWWPALNDERHDEYEGGGIRIFRSKYNRTAFHRLPPHFNPTYTMGPWYHRFVVVGASSKKEEGEEEREMG